MAFHLGNLVPGIEPTNDPLLQVRLFSYLDTQLTRLGGPNFGQLPINRPLAEVNDTLRDGMHQTQVHTGVAPYTPNSLGGGCPFPADLASAYVETRRPLRDAERVRANPESFEDHFSQAAMFYRSLTTIEQNHLAAAIAFELGKCHETEIRRREVGVLARVDSGLAAQVADELGLMAPEIDDVGDVALSPALRQVDRGPSPLAGRVIGVALSSSAPVQGLAPLVEAVAGQDVVVRLIAPNGHSIEVDGTEVTPERTYATTRSVEFDAVVLVADEVQPLDVKARILLQETYHHCKPILILGAMPDLDSTGIEAGSPGVLAASELDTKLVNELFELLAQHRVWVRETIITST